MVMTSWVLVISLAVSAVAVTTPAVDKPSTCNLAETNDVTLKVSPSSIYPKLTKTLTVNCSLIPALNSTIQSTMSVILSKEVGGQDIFRDVAVVTSHSPGLAEVKDTGLGGDVTANLTNGQAFLAVRWRQPSSEAAGQYKCLVYGVDKNGRPVASRGYATVTLQEESIDLLLKRLNEIEAVQSDFLNLTNRLNNSETKLVEVTLSLMQTQAETASLKRRLDGFREGMFEISTSFEGKVYLVSRLVLTDLANMDLACRLYGGHLAEVRTELQFRFIHDFLLTVLDTEQQVMLGATDEAAEGSWTYLTSGDRITYTKWKDGANGGSGSNCMMFTGTFRGHTYNGITTDPCKSRYLNRFLCEVPEAALKP